MRCLAIIIASAGTCVLAVSCSSSKPADGPLEPAPARSSTETTVPGEAGGVFEDSFTVASTIAALDPGTRRVTLKGGDGSTAEFTAPPEVRNFDQLRVGDRVRATISEQVVVRVLETGKPGSSHEQVAARAPKGAKPGAMVAESFQVVAEVVAIDASNRRATLRFADGNTETIPVRDDVELGRYRVGNHVLIRVTEQLLVVVEGT